MTQEEWVVVDSISGDLQAEILRGLLEAQGIMVFLSQEGAGHLVFPTMVGPLGIVELLVPQSSAEAAREILDAYYTGKLTPPDQEGEGSGEKPT